MRTHIVEAVWLNDAGLCSLDQLADYSGLTLAELQDLVEMGEIAPTSVDAENDLYQTHYIVIARTARRLRDDFELDGHGLAVALNLLRRIRELEAQLTHAQAKLPQ
ncbi:chaperone modulator CbpM [Glaciimonas sp. CA11.2]|uniref:chaperone modulator CbpM n=1 Tax=unclassified Glaciimonas TaxID=2644401 RepID=UPI002AB4883D|nr:MULTISPECIES: chaperone modulator CbpM [unclassified Glaciimonas]MDY7548671.1 chaperone modulator CbpM [Glaciimonas sp. CA11.2]MEB0014337.1 chaperone modulator CbpM [Glaciimonas sp. Cout2]MEB0083770.1 chaperone modulator CbpM [Glaciimonas sp. Gout2]MEB0164502.1 chaperone modulator CbpM [Glaciimonas sp. CA11.2]